MVAPSAYARAERFTTLKPQTLPKVGPNTYDLPDAITTCRDGFAPFNTWAPRTSERALRRLAALPSSADYYPRLRADIPGGSSMWYTAPRFRYKDDVDQPAPGDYEIRNEREAAEFRAKRPRGVGKLYVCRVPHSIGESPPTIPKRNTCYDLDPGGVLMTIEPSWHDLTLGPAFYDPRKSKVTSYERYKGCQWSKRTSRRETMKVREGPGPADYDVSSVKWDPAKCRDEAIRFAKRKTRKLPRYLDAVEINTRRENLPGPGYYNPYCEEKEGQKKKRGKKPKTPTHGFLSSAPRWKNKANENPGPGTYEEVRSAVCRPKPGSIKDSAFLVDAPRFPKPKGDSKPGPATYSIPGMKEIMARRMGSVYASFQPSFNNTEPRDLNFFPRDAPDFPAPGDYYVETRRSFNEPSAAFKSKTERMPKTIKNDQVHCATYNTDEAYKTVHDQRSHRYPEESSFDATTERFGRLTNVKNRNADPHNPSAAEYNLANYRPYRSGPGGAWVMAKRFAERVSDVPGPGSYTVHPSIGESCLIGTQNVTLGNPLPNRSTVLPRLFVSAKDKKKLRWFAQPPKNYIHCP